MILYLDTSVAVAAVTNETHSQRTQIWLERHESDEVLISDWVITEFSAALSIKLRTGQMTQLDRAASLGAFNRLCAASFGVAAISAAAFRTAAQLADRYALGLRAGDALHLAIAGQAGATLCTLDRRLHEAGPALGIPAELI